MLKLHAEIFRKRGKEQFVMLPYKEFVAIQEALEDAEDLILLEEARRQGRNESPIPLEDVMRRFGMKPSRTTARRKHAG